MRGGTLLSAPAAVRRPSTPPPAAPDTAASAPDATGGGGAAGPAAGDHPRESLRPIQGRARIARQRLSLRDELLLAALPTATVLLVLAFVEALSNQRLLFASLASSAFLIYLDPQHGTNRVQTLVVAQIGAAVIGWGVFALVGPGYVAAGSAMVVAIVLMITLDAVHPPAVATAMSFALRAGDEANLMLFGLAVGITALLVLTQRVALWIVARAAHAVVERAPVVRRRVGRRTGQREERRAGSRADRGGEPPAPAG